MSNRLQRNTLFRINPNKNYNILNHSILYKTPYKAEQAKVKARRKPYLLYDYLAIT